MFERSIVVWGELVAHEIKERDSMDMCVLSRFNLCLTCQLSVNMQPRSHVDLVCGLENAIMSCSCGDALWQERCG